MFSVCTPYDTLTAYFALNFVFSFSSLSSLCNNEVGCSGTDSVKATGVKQLAQDSC